MNSIRGESMVTNEMQTTYTNVQLLNASKKSMGTMNPEGVNHEFY